MSRNAEVWTQLETVKSPADRVKIAEDFPDSPASTWARLEAASDYYHQGVDDLPNNKDVALPTLKKALENFDEVAKTAPKDSPQARVAAMGKARTLEARGELTKAVEQYELVEKTWPGTAEGEHAKRLAAELKRPDAAAFYKELYAYTPDQGDPAAPGHAGLQHAPDALARRHSDRSRRGQPGRTAPVASRCSLLLRPAPAAKTEPAPAKGKEAAPAPRRPRRRLRCFPPAPSTPGPGGQASARGRSSRQDGGAQAGCQARAAKTETPKK